MRKMLLLSIWLFSAIRCQPPTIHLLAQEGGLVEISCHYDSGYEPYPKYFRKGLYGKRRTLIQTGKKNESARKGKYYLFDDTKQRILHVTIHNLNLNDGGTYWCEIDTNGFDPKTEIELRVHKAPPPPKPPLVNSNIHLSTTVQAINRNQQQSARITVSESASRTTLWSTPPQDTGHLPLVVPPLAGKELYLALAAAAAAVLLLSLLLVFYCRLRKHRHDRARATVGCEAETWINTCNTQPAHTEHHSRGQQRELDPSVNVSSSDSTYAAVTSRRAPGAHAPICHPVRTQTQMANPMFSSSISSCLQDEASARTINQHRENVCHVSSPSAEAGDQHTHQARGQIRSAAGPSDVYATISRPET